MNVIAKTGESRALQCIGAWLRAQVPVGHCDLESSNVDDALQQSMLDEFDRNRAQQAKIVEMSGLVLAGNAIRRIIASPHLGAAGA